MVMKIRDLILSCDTNADGDIVHRALIAHLRGDRSVIVSFSGMDTVTSSFVNSAFVPLLETMSFDELKRRVRFADVTRQIGDLIRRRLAQTAGKNTLAA
jgi:hypothetical protein